MGLIKFHVRNSVDRVTPIVGAKVNVFQVGGSIGYTFYTDSNGDVGGSGSTDDPNPTGVQVDDACNYYNVSAQGYKPQDHNLIGTNWVYLASSAPQPPPPLPNNDWVEVAYCYRVDSHTFKINTRLKVRKWNNNLVQLEIMVSDHEKYEEEFWIPYTGQLTEYTFTLQNIGFYEPNVGIYAYLVNLPYDGWILQTAEVPLSQTPPPAPPPTPPETRKIMISAQIGGTTDPTPGIHTYPKNTVFTVTAIPDSTHNFGTFIYDGYNVPVNPLGVTMDIDHTLEAQFIVKTTAPPTTPPETPKPPVSNQLKWAGLFVGIGILGFLAYWIKSR